MFPVVFHRTTRALVSFVLSSLFFLGIGALMSMSVIAPSGDADGYSTFVVVALMLLTVALGLGGLVASLLLWSRRHEPALVVDELGFTDKPRAGSAGRVRWADVRSLRIVEQRRLRYVGVELIDLDGYLARFDPGHAMLMRTNIGLVGTPIAVTTHGLDRSPEEILAVMTAALEQWRARTFRRPAA